ncbi:MAG: hypothetical protein HDR51_02385 [Treponema sp.]|nr:hypothetical protein [Treponema sp.]
MAASGILTKISQDDINWARQTSIDLWERDRLTEKDYMEEVTRELAEKKAALAETNAALAEKTEALAESHAALTEKTAVIEEKDAKLLALLREIELLRAELANKKATEKL